MDLQRPKHGLKKSDENDEAAITSINCQKSVLSFENNQVSVIQNFQKAFAEIDILTISFYNTVRRQSKQGKPPTVKPILIWQIAHSLSQKVIKKTQVINYEKLDVQMFQNWCYPGCILDFLNLCQTGIDYFSTGLHYGGSLFSWVGTLTGICFLGLLAEPYHKRSSR